MVIKCTIQFENSPHGTYFSGELMKGVVILETFKDKKIKGVLLKIKGFAKTGWSEDSNSTSTDGLGNSTTTTKTTYYGSTEEYIANVIPLMEQNKTVLERGVHTFTFECRIPPECPSSFEALYGHIRYMVKVVVIRPWKCNECSTQGFTVLSSVDLNMQIPDLRTPIRNYVAKSLGWSLFSKSSPLLLQAAIPQGGYVPGQDIPVTVLADNRSSKPIVKVRLQLKVCVVHHDRPDSKRTKTEEFPITIFEGDAVSRNSKKVFNYLVPVPATPPTCINRCGLIKLNYHIIVEAITSCLGKNPKILLPVMIGTIPLRPSSSRSRHSEPRHVERATTVEHIAQGSESLPPPTYKEAVYMPAARISAPNKHDYGPSTFSPSYAVYDISSPKALTPDEAKRFFTD